MMNKKRHDKAVRLGLVKFSASQSFVNRNKPGGKGYLIDSRGSGTNIALRELIIDGLNECLAEFPGCELIAGVANSGTHWAAILADRNHLLFSNILKEPRKSGMKRQVEGEIAGKQIILVDNCAESGQSMRDAIDIVKEHGGIPVGAILISDRAAHNHRFGIPFAYAFSIPMLLEYAVAHGLVTETLTHDFLTINK